MSRRLLTHGVLLAALLSPVPVHAQAHWLRINSASPILSEAARVSKEREGLFGAVVLGYQGTTGNTETASRNAKASFGYVALPWRHALMLRALLGSSNEATTAEDYEVAQQSDYVLGDGHYLYEALNYTDSRFSGYEWRTSGVVGYGRQILDTATHVLDLQVGAGTRRSHLSDGSREHEEIVQVAGGYYNTDVPSGRAKTDTATLVSVNLWILTRSRAARYIVFARAADEPVG